MDSLKYGVRATYKPQRLPRHQGNALIEALPPALGEEQVINMLAQLPDYKKEQRDWSTADRMGQVAGLANFCLPLARHVRLVMALDAMIREGYVGRAPRSAEQVAKFQKIYEQQLAGQALCLNPGATSASLSASLIGLSGMGKTTTLRRFQRRFPEVIFHPELHIWQIPCLHVEMPHDGHSVKGLAHAILRKIDALIPDAHYYETYALKGRPSVETLLNHVARVLNIHCVGVLICDEIENLCNAPKEKQALMTLLVSCSNELGVPLVFVGTNKAKQVLTLDFRQARRSVGSGLSYWDRLEQGTPDNPGEWDVFLSVLWRYQWVKTPIALNPMLSNLMYHHSQGIIDITIKLFAACQLRAMLDGCEVITAQLISDVAKTELALVHPMIEALRTNDLKALEAYDDIRSVAFDQLLESAKIKLSGHRILGASVGPGDSAFAPLVSQVLEGLGVGAEQAEGIAERVEAEGNSVNVLDAAKKAIECLVPPKRVRAAAKERGKEIELAPNDLRNAHRLAEAEKTPVFDQLKRMGAVCDLRAVINF